MLEDGIPIVGVVSAPAIARRWWARPGAGVSTFDGRSLREIAVSPSTDSDAASLSSRACRDGRNCGIREQFLCLTDDVWRVRGFGDFYSYCLLAEGAVDMAAEPEVSLWDLAALDVIVREAGGRFGTLDGARPTRR